MASLEKKGGFFSVRYRDRDGKPRRISVNKIAGRDVTKRSEAEQFMQRWLARNVVTDFSAPQKIPLADLLRRYDAYASQRFSTTTYRAGMPRLRDFVEWMSENGAMFQDAVTPLLIEDYRTALLEHGMQPQTANKYLEGARAFFNRLHAWRLVERSPFDGFEMQKTHKREMRLLSDDEIARLLAVCDDPDLRDVITIALQTGMRQGELVRMRWADIQVDGIHIPKTKSYRPRTIPFGPGVKDLLERRRTERGWDADARRKSTGEQVFGDQSGNVWYQRLARTYQRAGINGATFHSLRHTFASRILRAGANIKIVQDLMGHTEIRTTLQYVHLYDGDRQAAMDRLSLPEIPAGMELRWVPKD